MKYYFLDRIIVIAAFISMMTLSCQKGMNANRHGVEGIHHVAFVDKQEYLHMNQAIVVYDSTRIVDSIDWVHPPTNPYYEWTITPGNGCDSVVGNNKGPFLELIFQCPGDFKITGKLYDSATHNFVGNTDTILVQVGSKTLYPTEPIHPNDILNIRPAATQIWFNPNGNPNSPPDSTTFGVYLWTEDKYEYGFWKQFEFTSNSRLNDFSYLYSTQLKLNTFPFAYGYGIQNNVEGGITFPGASIGMPIQLSITWLNVKYSGSITFISESRYTYDWNNSGAVRIH